MTDVSDERFRLLIVDDEPNIRSGLAKGLAAEVDELNTASSPDAAMKLFSDCEYQLVIADVRLNSPVTGIDLVAQMVRLRPQTTVIVITAHGTLEIAVEAMRAGAFDFIAKPLNLALVRQQVRKARQHHQLQSENVRLRSQLADAGEISGIIGGSEAMQSVFRQVRQVASTEATVMIQGESGTGKELIARAVHDLSPRSGGPFIAVNLGAMPESLLESELFGYEKGSFSGAARQKPGCFEQAAGGTLFLDEVTEMPAKSQVDLLRVLESQTFMRVGGEQLQTTDVRIVSASNRIVQSLIQDGTFREDLYYRLNVIPIEVPSLRGRRDDIPLLVEHFLSFFCVRHGRPPKRLAGNAMEVMLAARWPGNVRQLRNVIERMVITHVGEMVQASELPVELSTNLGGPAVPEQTLAEAVEQCERDVISAALAHCNSHREQTAKKLGISIRTLHYKMGRYGLH